MQKFLLNTFRDFIIVQASNFTKDDLLCRYFAKILTRSTEQLFRRHFLMTNSENIEIFNSLITVDDIVFLLFLIDTEKTKNHKIQVV